MEISKKIVALKWSWTGRLYDEGLHEWKLIPLNKSFVNNFKFYSNLHALVYLPTQNKLLERHLLISTNSLLNNCITIFIVK